MRQPLLFLVFFLLCGLTLSTNVSAIIAQEETPVPVTEFSPSATFTPPIQPLADDAVLQALRNRGTVNVIVGLNVIQMQGASDTMMRAAVTDTQQGALAGLARSNFVIKHQYSLVPAMALTVDEAGLNALLSNPLVTAVELDQIVTGFLDESTALIGADTLHSTFGITGEGVTVAVFDSGVDTDHPDLADNVVAQACFTRSKCVMPLGGDAPSSRIAEDEHGHGTHVTGIITASGLTTERGVAPDTDIVVIRVLDENNNGSFSDILAGLEWLYNNQSALQVDAINMSIGGSAYASDCDRFTVTAESLFLLFEDLRELGITTFVSSGNNGYTDRLSLPACLSNVVAVGATYDANIGQNYGPTAACTDNTTAPDRIACGSNVSSGLDLLAPGSDITSTWLAGGSATIQGTSMAAPMAAGAAALALQVNPYLTPVQIEYLLTSTGIPVLDSRVGMSFPRVDALEAVSQAAYNDDIQTPLVFDLPEDTLTLHQYNMFANQRDNEPLPSCDIDTYNTLWYQFVAPANDSLLIDTIGSGFDTVLSVWTGDTSNLTEVSCSEDVSGETYSLLTLNVNAGEVYTLMIGSDTSLSGKSVLNIKSVALGAPQIINTWPTHQSYDADIQTPIFIEFDRDVALTSDQITLICGDEATAFTVGPVLPVLNTRSLTLYPESPLEINTLCAVTVPLVAVTNAYDGTPLLMNGENSTVYSFAFVPTQVRSSLSRSIQPLKQFGTGALPLQINDSITVEDPGALLDLDVMLDVDHEYLGELTIALTSPMGTPITLFDRRAGSDNDLEATIFDDEAETPIWEGLAPFAGSFQPAEALSGFDGESIQGDWWLTLTDAFGQANIGYLAGARLDITYKVDVTSPSLLDLQADTEGVLLTFDEPVTLVSQSLTVACPADGVQIPLLGLPAYNVISAQVYFNGMIPYDTACTVTVNAAEITDMAGNFLNPDDDLTDTFQGPESPLTPTSSPSPTQETPESTETPVPTDTQTPEITVPVTDTATVTPEVTASETATLTETPMVSSTAEPTTEVPSLTPPTTTQPPPTETPTLTATSVETIVPSIEPTQEVLQPGETDTDTVVVNGVILPEFVWMPVLDDSGLPEVAQWYNIVIVNESGEIVLNTWVQGSIVCGVDGCAFVPGVNDLPAGLPSGTYTWWLSGWSDGNYTGWIETPLVIPDTPAPSDVAIDISSGQPVIRMADTTDALWVHLYIGTVNFETIYLGWIEKTEANCDGQTCVFAPDVYLSTGSYVVYIQTWGPAGFNQGDVGYWSGPYTFALDVPAPGLPTQLEATQMANGKVMFSWQPPENALWYQIWIGIADPLQTLHYRWYNGRELGCAEGRCQASPDVTFVPGKTYSWYIQAWGPGGITTEGNQGWIQGTPFTP